MRLESRARMEPDGAGRENAPIAPLLRGADSVVGMLARPAPIVPDTTTCGAIAETFSNGTDTPAIIIRMAADRYGLVDRASFLQRYLVSFNRELYQRKSIANLMDAKPLVVDWTTPIDRAGILAAGEGGEILRSAFIIVRDGACMGIGLGIDLMRMVAKEAVERLRHLHQTQDHLVQAQTFASLGRLVAGVAHEINTPIGVSLTAASHMRDRVAEVLKLFNERRLRQSDLVGFAAAADEASSIIVQNIERAAGLIKSFKSVAADQTTAERRRFNLLELIKDTGRSVSPELRKNNVNLSVKCDPGITMDSYPGALTQALTNLMFNAAIHAFEPGQQGRFEVTALSVGDWVEIKCADNGRGIPVSDLKHVFEPFFTTRRSQGGTGLGLHIVHNIVTQILDGTIE